MPIDLALERPRTRGVAPGHGFRGLPSALLADHPQHHGRSLVLRVRPRCVSAAHRVHAHAG
jgi:hypothetical protein